jgi:hypothetical protein
MAMPKDELIAKLIMLQDRKTKSGRYVDTEGNHEDADAALIEYINDPEIKVVYESLTKWYG